jgi:hypothetical protein
MDFVNIHLNEIFMIKTVIYRFTSPPQKKKFAALNILANVANYRQLSIIRGVD